VARTILKRFSFFVVTIWSIVKFIGDAVALYINKDVIKLYDFSNSTSVTEVIKRLHYGTIESLQARPYLYFSSLFSILIIIICLQGQAKKRGGHCSNLYYRSLFFQINPIRIHKTVTLIHDFEHIYYEELEKIISLNNGPMTIDNKIFIKSMESLLENIRITVSTSLCCDVSATIKLFQDKLTNGPACMKLEDAQLKNYIRSPSKRESRLINKGHAAERNDSDVYKIILGDDGLPHRLKNTHRIDKDCGFKVNSAYNYLFGNRDHYWVCNNLRRAESLNKYYTTATKNIERYNSLALFLILHPIKPGTEIPYPQLGILQIDSHKKGLLDSIRLRMVAGYFAHRLYDFLQDALQPIKKSAS